MITFWIVAVCLAILVTLIVTGGSNGPYASV